MPADRLPASAPPRIVVSALKALIGLLERGRRALMPPELYLLDTALISAVRSHAVLASVRLGLFGVLRDGPRTAAEVARALEADPDATWRLLRALASFGILDGERDRYALNACSRLLLPEHPRGFEAALQFNADPRHFTLWGQFADTLRGAVSPFEAAYGKPLFSYLAEDRRMGAFFDRAMNAGSGPTSLAVCAAWAPPERARIVDVGGGHGHFLAALLSRHPGTTGILFDSPEVLAGADAMLDPVASRVTRTPGNFFEEVPQGGDVYVLMHILHNWGGEACERILKNCRRAMGPTARLLIIDMIVPPGNPAHPGPILDLVMYSLLRDGRERTEAELRRLIDASGLVIERIIPTVALTSIVELRRAE